MFWTLAALDLIGVVVLAALGVRAIRRRDLSAHRRRMLGAALLVALFLVSYLGKLAWLGREDRSQWSPGSLGVLYVHESCIAVMLLAGGYAAFRAWRFGGGLAEPGSRARGRVHHRRAGWAALVASALASATALAVLAGMYARAD